jgi:hypothetical protein
MWKGFVGFLYRVRGAFVLFTKRKFSFGRASEFFLLAFSGEFPPFPSSPFFFRFSAVGLFRSIWIL